MSDLIKLIVNGYVTIDGKIVRAVDIKRNNQIIGQAYRFDCGRYLYKNENISAARLKQLARAIPIQEGEALGRQFQQTGNAATFVDETGDSLTVNLSRNLIIINDGKKNRRSVLMTPEAWRGLRDMLKAKID